MMEYLSRNDSVKGFISLTVVMALCLGAFSVMSFIPTNARADVVGGEYGSIVNVGIVGGLSTGDPSAIATVDEWKIASLVYDSLARTDPDTLDSVPWVADSWEVIGYRNNHLHQFVGILGVHLVFFHQVLAVLNQNWNHDKEAVGDEGGDQGILGDIKNIPVLKWGDG